MERYQGFASVYDEFMEEVDYSSWISHIKKIWERQGLRPEMIFDIGCGTGNALLPLAKEGYSLIGVDISEEMLAESQRKIFSEEGLDVKFFCQDVTELELPCKADCILSLCDTVNYITEQEELYRAFSAVSRHLNKNGLFIFDVNTEYKFKEILGNDSYAATNEDAAYFWENSYDEEERINEYYVTFFLKQAGSELYERIEEYHYERAHSAEEIKKALEKSGFDIVGVYNGYSFEKAGENSERLLFAARLTEGNGNE